MICIVPRIYIGSVDDLTVVDCSKYHIISAEDYVTKAECAKEILWWAWGHNEDVLIYSIAEASREDAVVYFLRECMAFTEIEARKFIEAKK